jgi:fructose/tagatose bisphosphate aldolase
LSHHSHDKPIIRQLADAYGVRVILHTDHAAKKLLPWVDGLIEATASFPPRLALGEKDQRRQPASRLSR